MTAKRFPRSQIKAICEQLGHDPTDVTEITIRHDLVVVTRLQRDRNGDVSMGLFGPNTWDGYHRVDEDDEDLDRPPSDGVGAGS